MFTHVLASLFVLSAAAAPPPGLYTDPFRIGESAEFLVTDAPAGAAVAMVFGVDGAGGGPCLNTGPCTDIADPLAVVRLRVGADGTLRWSTTMPEWAAGEEVCVQAVIAKSGRSMRTQAVCRTVSASATQIAAQADTYVVVHHPVGRDTAATVCGNEGLSLALPWDAESNAALRDALDAAGFAGVPVWMGIDDRANEGAFVDAAGYAPFFTAWPAGQPSDATGEADCVVQRADGSWDTASCDTAQVAVCEGQLVGPVTALSF